MGTKWPSALDPARTHRTWGEGTPSQGQALRGSFLQGSGQGVSIFQDKPDITSSLFPLSEGGRESVSVGGWRLPAQAWEQGRIGSGPPEPSDILLFSLIYLYDYIVGDPFTFIRAFVKVAF